MCFWRPLAASYVSAKAYVIVYLLKTNNGEVFMLTVKATVAELWSWPILRL